MRALGIVLYYLGLPFRGAPGCPGGFRGAAHELVRRWFHRGRGILDPLGRDRRAVAADETAVWVEGREWYPWVAFDVDRPEVLASWVTPARSSFEAMQFFRAAVKRCSKRPLVMVDRRA